MKCSFPVHVLARAPHDAATARGTPAAVAARTLLEAPTAARILTAQCPRGAAILVIG